MKYLILLFFLFNACEEEKKYTSLLLSEGSRGTSSITPGEAGKIKRFEVFRKVISDHCVSCHIDVPVAEAPNHDFNSLDDEAKWLASPYVTANDPNASSIYYVLKGAGVDIFLENMPKIGSLSSSELKIVKDWIEFVDADDPIGNDESNRCGTADSGGAQARLDVVRGIMQSRCTSCHSPNGNAALSDLSFTTDEEAKNRVVEPGSLFGSPVYYRLRGAKDVRPGQNRDMPQGGNALSAAQVQAIEDWVCMMPD